MNRSPTRGEVFTFPIKFGLFRPQGARFLPFPLPLSPFPFFINISASYPDIPPFAIISYKERKLDAEFSFG
jgi:hypothetical protein